MLDSFTAIIQTLLALGLAYGFAISLRAWRSTARLHDHFVTFEPRTQ